MKRFLALFFVGSFTFFGMFGVSNAQGLWDGGGFFYDDTPVSQELDTLAQATGSENLGSLAAKGIVTSDSSLLNSFLKMFGFGGAEYAGVPKALIYVKFIINLLLGLVSFIALVIILYSFYMMFFTEDSKGIEAVKKNLTGVAIALVILGLSWIIVSFIFDFYQSKLLGPT